MSVGSAASRATRRARALDIAEASSSATGAPAAAATYNPVHRAHTGSGRPPIQKHRSGRWWQTRAPPA